ncbi:MAG: hypothetical protein OXD31_09505 [Chloroflexi bacterium]|nr:hypothetical protein [Chloroflexota bacterium]
MKLNIWETELDARVLGAMVAVGTLFALFAMLAESGLVLTVVRFAYGVVGAIVIGYTTYCVLQSGKLRQAADGNASEIVYRRRILYGLFYIAVVFGVIGILRIVAWIG